MFESVELGDTCSSNTLRQTCTRTCAILWGITKPAEQNGNFIMIAGAISGHNYQRWLIHFLIASFNLFTFGAEECQAGANESNLLQGWGTDTRQWRLYVTIFMMTGILWSYSSSLHLNNVINNLKIIVWFYFFMGQFLSNRWESKLEGVKNRAAPQQNLCSEASYLQTRPFHPQLAPIPAGPPRNTEPVAPLDQHYCRRMLSRQKPV